MEKNDYTSDSTYMVGSQWTLTKEGWVALNGLMCLLLQWIESNLGTLSTLGSTQHFFGLCSREILEGLHSPGGERWSTYSWSLAYLTFFTTSGTVVPFLRHCNPFWVSGKLSEDFEPPQHVLCILRIYYLLGWIFFQKDKVLIPSGFSLKRASECSEQMGAEMG